MEQERAQWKSKFGFILAASGSAIGLGNIVFFPANAYRYGGGAFYVPYLVALFVIGIPVMALEFGLGSMMKKSFPLAMRKAGGRIGEFAGWWAILNAFVISMYYVMILGWVIGMFLGAVEEARKAAPVVFSGQTHVDWLGGKEGGGAPLDNPTGFFFDMISGWKPVIYVAIVWFLNWLLVSRGTKTIEAAVKVFVPLMWMAMLCLVGVGLFELEGGMEGVKFLFTPHAEILKNAEVWQGAMGQMFFTLTLGFGVMTAYASYLPKNTDHTHNAITTSLLNCGFEWIAGVAIFAILFAFSISPKASTLAMMFFIVPKGIAAFPWQYQVFGIGFFFLLLIAGLTSSISLIEALVSAAQDKFKAPRWKTLSIACLVGFLGSCCFALPQIVNPGLEDNGTLGLTLLDLVDHWAFSYGLLIVGLVECILLGWVLGASKIRKHINKTSRFQLAYWNFDLLIQLVIPLVILFVLGWNLWFGELDTPGKEIAIPGTEGLVKGDGIYGLSYTKNFEVGENKHFLSAFLQFSPWFSMLAWLVFTCGVGLLLTAMRRADPLADEAADFFEDPVGVTEDEIWDDGEDEDSLEDDQSGNGGPIQ